MGSFANFCIPADPDVSGIGVRTSIYAQNILTFIPAFYALWDGVVTHKELHSVKKHSTTILLTAFAILVSAYVWAPTKHLTNYHTLIVLHLSWMNNTNALVYSLLYVHHNGRAFLSWHAFHTRYIESWDVFYKHYIVRVLHPSEWYTEDLVVFLLGSLHLSLMAILGVWFWSDVEAFGNVVACHPQPIISVIGVHVPFNSQILRGMSLALYSFILIPVFNLLVPMTVVCISYGLWNRSTVTLEVAGDGSTNIKHPCGASAPSIAPITIWLLILLALNILFAVDIELTLIHNRALQSTGEGVWSFGQSLALLMLFQPLWALGKSMWKGLKLADEINQFGSGEDAFKQALVLERLDIIGTLAPKVDDIDIEGGRFGNALQLASYHGNMNLVRLLLDYGADPDSVVKSTSGTALQAAAARGNRKVVKYLAGKVRNVNACGGELGYALQAASFSGDACCVRALLDAGADRNLQGGRFKTALHAAVCSGSEMVMRMLLQDEKERPSSEGRPVSRITRATPSSSGAVIPTRSKISEVANFTVLDSNGNTPLHLAVQRSSRAMISLLLQLGCNPDVRNHHSQTALHSASMNGQLDIVRLLLENSALIDLQDKDCHTALHYAKVNGHMAVVGLLLENEPQMEGHGTSGPPSMRLAVTASGTLSRFCSTMARACLHEHHESGMLHYVPALLHSAYLRSLCA